MLSLAKQRYYFQPAGLDSDTYLNKIKSLLNCQEDYWISSGMEGRRNRILRVMFGKLLYIFQQLDDNSVRLDVAEKEEPLLTLQMDFPYITVTKGLEEKLEEVLQKITPVNYKISK